MKKAEFLEAIKGHRIECLFVNNCDDVMANGYPVFYGLPKAVTHLNPKDLLGRLKAMVPYTEKEHPSLKYYKKYVNKILNEEQETGLTLGIGDAMEWIDWYERHPILIFEY